MSSLGNHGNVMALEAFDWSVRNICILNLTSILLLCVASWENQKISGSETWTFGALVVDRVVCSDISTVTMATGAAGYWKTVSFYGA